MKRELTRTQSIERSILTTYRKDLWRPFVQACKRYNLIENGDKIAVCISGGKDSMLLAKLMQLLQRISDVPFELEFLVMDPGYAPRNRQRIVDNADVLGIPIHVVDSDIFAVADTAGGSPCYLCARMRRGFLYAHAKALGCNKIALGHHKSDVIETTLMGMLYGAQLQAMLPKLQSTNFEGMQLIRPMYCIVEEAIIRWCKHNDLQFLQCACSKTAALPDGMAMPSARQDTKKLIAELKKHIPDVEQHIFESIHNVQLDTMVGYKTGGVTHSFEERLAKSQAGNNAKKE